MTVTASLLKRRFLTSSTRGDAYSEEAFQYLLAVERKRSVRSGQPAILLLVRPRQNGVEVPLNAEVAETLFTSLRGCIRETDFIGWYRKDYVVGAVLTQVGDRLGSCRSCSMGEKVTKVWGRMPEQVADGLEVKASQLPSKREGYG
jgi:hypothetical protein